MLLYMFAAPHNDAPSNTDVNPIAKGNVSLAMCNPDTISAETQRCDAFTLAPIVCQVAPSPSISLATPVALHHIAIVQAPGRLF